MDVEGNPDQIMSFWDVFKNWKSVLLHVASR